MSRHIIQLQNNCINSITEKTKDVSHETLKATIKQRKELNKMENLETFLKNEEEKYKTEVLKKSTFWLETEYHAFNLAIKENVQWIEDAYEDYMNEDIKKDMFERRIKQNELDIIHWQNMIEIVVEELLKRSEKKLNDEKN